MGTVAGLCEAWRWGRGWEERVYAVGHYVGPLRDRLDATIACPQAGTEDGYVDVPVVRKGGSDGRVTVQYETKDGTGPAALAGERRNLS